jgi:hypothetical protein
VACNGPGIADCTYFGNLVLKFYDRTLGPLLNMHHSATKTIPGSRIQTLLAWMDRAGVAYDKKLLEFVDERNGSCAITEDQVKIIAKEKIQASTKIGRIPKAACLSLLNVPSVHSRIEEFGLDDDDDIALAAAITHEMAIGKKSQWFGYLSSLPVEGEFIPLLWPDDLLDCIRDCDLYEEVIENKRRYSYYWEAHVLPLLSDALGSTACRRLSLETFLRAVSFAGSRAFFVDRDHGEALVPLADMFNHKMAFLPTDAEVEGASSDDDDRDTDGSADGDSTRGGDDSADEDRDEDVAPGDREARAPEREMDMALGSYEGRDWLPVVALRAVPRGCEVRASARMRPIGSPPPRASANRTAAGPG